MTSLFFLLIDEIGMYSRARTLVIMNYITFQKNVRSQIKKVAVQGIPFGIVEFQVLYLEAYFMTELLRL